MRKTAFVIGIPLLLAGCTDLAAVNGMSARLVGATAGWNDVAGEFERSCEQVMLYAPPDMAGADVPDCTQDKLTSEGLVGANKILLSYFKALQSASQEDALSIDEGLGDVAVSVGNIPGVDADRAEAAGGMFRFLSGLARRRAQDDILKDLITGGAPLADDMLALLSDTVGSRLELVLKQEEGLLFEVYRSYLRQPVRGVSADNGPFIAGLKEACENGIMVRSVDGLSYLLARDYCERKAVLDGRVAALEEYGESITNARAALSELQSSKSRLSSKALAIELVKIGRELDKNIDTVEDAFSTGDGA